MELGNHHKLENLLMIEGRYSTNPIILLYKKGEKYHEMLIVYAMNFSTNANVVNYYNQNGHYMCCHSCKNDEERRIFAKIIESHSYTFKKYLPK